MNNQKHSPGPWVIAEETIFKGYIYVINSDEDEPICRIPFYTETKADASLIAAAPEMLEALESTLNLLTNDRFSPFLDGPLINLRDEVKSAIAKAKSKISEELEQEYSTEDELMAAAEQKWESDTDR